MPAYGKRRQLVNTQGYAPLFNITGLEAETEYLMDVSS